MSDSLDPQLMEDVGKLFDNFLTGLGEQLTSKMKELEDQMEGIEKQIATLIVGYGEQAVFMEALVAQLSFATDEERKAFTENVSEGRKEMLKVMQDAANGTMATEYPQTSAAITDLVEQELSDPDLQ